MCAQYTYESTCAEERNEYRCYGKSILAINLYILIKMDKLQEYASKLARELELEEQLKLGDSLTNMQECMQEYKRERRESLEIAKAWLNEMKINEMKLNKDK